MHKSSKERKERLWGKESDAHELFADLIYWRSGADTTNGVSNVLIDLEDVTDGKTVRETWEFSWVKGSVRCLQRGTGGVFYNKVVASETDIIFFRDCEPGKKERVRITFYRRGEAGGDIRSNTKKYRYDESYSWERTARFQFVPHEKDRTASDTEQTVLRSV